eukprot:2695164-Pyramimonas_sp.AAC.1
MGVAALLHGCSDHEVEHLPGATGCISRRRWPASAAFWRWSPGRTLRMGCSLKCVVPAHLRGAPCERGRPRHCGRGNLRQL